MAVTITIRCREHPNYGGVRKPRAGCKACFNLRMFVTALNLPEGMKGLGGFTYDAIGTLDTLTMYSYVHSKA